MLSEHTKKEIEEIYSSISLIFLCSNPTVENIDSMVFLISDDNFL